MKRVLIDTGPLVAILSESDQYHAACVEAIRDISTPAYTCWPVITEAAYLLRSQPVRVAELIAKCDGSRFELLSLSASDLPGVNRILKRFADQAFQLADVCLMHLAERDGIPAVFTLDSRHFGVFRTDAGPALELVP